MKQPAEPFYDQGASRYDRRKADRVGARIWLHVVLEAIEHLPLGPKPWRVLDAGGGTGRVGVPLAERGHEVVIADVSAKMLQIAQDKAEQAGVANRITTVKTDICDLSELADDRFDLALALGDPLSYCTDAARGLAELHRVTRKGGMLFAEVENRFTASRSTGRRGSGWAELRDVLRTGQATMPDAPDFHIRMFEPTELHLLLQEAGWRPVHTMAGHLLWALLGEEVLQQAGDDPQQFAEMVATEKKLRACRDLWGAGGDIQVLACK